MDDRILQLAQTRFGISYLFPLQRLIITNILEAALNKEGYNRQLILLPTGAGKSLCFQLPALLLSGHTLLICPILGLMSDQQRRMKEAGIDCLLLRGGQDREERKAIFSRIEDARPVIIISNPETITLPSVQSQLSRSPVMHMVIDEAHCIHEWGLQFRPSFLALGECIEKIDVPIVTAFTATASEKIVNTIKKVLFPNGGCHIIRGNPDRPNIYYRIVETYHPLGSLIMQLQKKLIEQPCLVFGRTRNIVSAASHLLRQYNIPSYFYHAGLDKSERDKIEKWFFHRDDGILCATCAYGMGIDKANIRSVVHLAAPESVEAYLQEAGRGGRDRKPSEATLMKLPEDTVLAGYGNPGACLRQHLLSQMGDNCEFCDNCAVCRKEETPWEGFSVIPTLVSRYPRRFTARQLAKQVTHTAPRLPLNVFQEAITSALQCKRIKKIPWGPWKNQLAQGNAEQE